MVMQEREIAVLIEQGDRRRRARDWAGAIGLYKRALSLDPEHAQAHAALALGLLGARRLHGATIEIELALAFDGDDAFCNYAAAAVRRAERKLDDAWQHCAIALQHDDSDADTRVLGAAIRMLRNERSAARALLDEALAIAPDHVDALATLARLELGDGRIAEAKQAIERALRADPTDVEAHVVAGYIDLRSSDVDDAEQHARFALAADAGSRDSLELWTAIKARRSFVLGLWWRFNAFVSLRSERAQIGIMIGSFFVVRLAIIVAGGLGFEDLEDALAKAWLGFCAYTWVAPGLFRRMLQRELGSVVLREDY
jgi:tetratricopeptide (TPR) repeat protein